MKKIFTLICALAAVFTTAQAQNVVFTYGGETLENGAEVTAQAVDWTEFGMGFMADSNTPSALEVKNIGGSSVNVSVNVKVINGEYSVIKWCGITQQCQSMSSTSETRSTTLAAGATARLNLDTEFHEGEYGVRSVLVTATANGESVSMTFHMENKQAEAAVVSTKTYTDNLIVTINEESTEPMAATITMEEMADGTYNLSLKNFALVAGDETLPVGNINLTGITLTEEKGYKTFATQQVITIAAGDTGAEDEWLGPMLGEVPINMQGKLTDEKLYCTIDIDMMASLEQIIKVTFGENFEVGPAVVSTKAYTDNLIVSINEESTEPMPATIIMEELEDGTYNLSLKNFALVAGDEALPVGNINLKGITLTEGNGCKEFATQQVITIAAGDTGAEDEWLGPMLGEVPIDMKGQLTAEKLYCTIDIDMMATLEQIIKVTFGEELTGIAAVQGNATRVNVYGIDGRIVRSNVVAADALNGLPRGIYVVGGKKVLK